MPRPPDRTRLAPACTIVALAACAILAPHAARAEFAVIAYGGASLTADGNVRLEQSGGTQLTFHGVSWAGESRQRPIYYGFRGTWWLPRSPRWGVSLDYTHVKAIARVHREVGVSGTRAGAPVDDREPLVQTFGALAFSHGLNLATVSAVYRRLPRSADGATDAAAVRRRLQPYASLGAGVTVPHVEITTAGASADGYQVSGPAFVGGVGVDARLVGPVSALAEYRLSWARVKADLSPEGSVVLHPWTSHLALGLSIAIP